MSETATQPGNASAVESVCAELELQAEACATLVQMRLNATVCYIERLFDVLARCGECKSNR